MKSDINCNNEKRTTRSKNKDKFGVDQCKLMTNLLFGKRIENVEGHNDTKIANN